MAPQVEAVETFSSDVEDREGVLTHEGGKLDAKDARVKAHPEKFKRVEPERLKRPRRPKSDAR